MRKKELLSRIDFLRKKAELNKLVIFVGAGVSCNVEGFYNWSDLIVEMAREIGYEKCSFCRHKDECNKKCGKRVDKTNRVQQCFLKDDFSTDEFLRIPQYVYNKASKTYYGIIKKCVPVGEKDAPLSEAIFEINPAHIITTNYDKLLESSNSVFRNQYDVIIEDKDLLNAEKGKYIIKMHGDISYPKTIVLKEQDYLDYSQKHVLIELFVKALLADHTILFLGYSLNDYNIKLIISWINYLRVENGLLPKNKKIGYLVLDEERVNKDTLGYFKNNSIEVINIRLLPEIANIPTELISDKGRRLYSFLKTISNPALEDAISSKLSLDNAIDFVWKHKIYDYRIMLKLLNVRGCILRGSTLDFYEEYQYSRLESYFKMHSDKARLLKQSFVDVGIDAIQCYYHDDVLKRSFYPIDAEMPNELFNDQFYTLYIQNRYSELKELCDQNAKDKIKTSFYKHFAIGYLESAEDYEEIDFNALDICDKVSYLHNLAVIESMNTFGIGFNSDRVKGFINNIPLAKERNLFEGYLDMYNGNASKRLEMVTSLDKLKNNIEAIPTTVFSNGAVSEIYNIRRNAITEYLFYYRNNLFMLGFNDIAIFFRPFIEAVLVANKEAAERTSYLLEFELINGKYPVSAIDFDIISKYISVKELIRIIDENKIEQIRTEEEVAEHLVGCFTNLASSVVKEQTFGHRDSSICIIANLALLLTKIKITNEAKTQLSVAVFDLFANDNFNKHFWNIGRTGFAGTENALSRLIEILPPIEPSMLCIRSIIYSPGFFEFLVNSSFSATKSILLFFLNEKMEDVYQNDLTEIVNAEPEFKRKVTLLRLFYKRINDESVQKRYKSLLSENFTQIGTQAIYDFALSGWIKPSKNDIDKLIKDTLRLYGARQEGIQSSTDPVKTNLECLYLLYIFGLAKDLSGLEELSHEYPHLSFLLSPDTFNYELVDFSNYMWENFARNEQLMKKFKENKNVIVSNIKEKMAKDMATEAEKRILYGFLLRGKEVWQY